MPELGALFANEYLRTSLVRADDIEAWAPWLYPLESLPACTVFVRRALLLLCRDGRVRYRETSRLGFRLFRAKRWDGHLADLGQPRPASPGFIAAKGLRLRSARSRSIVLTIGGRRKIIFFTGVTKSRGLPKGLGGLRNIPQAGILFGWVESAVIRARNPHSVRQGTEAAQAWCSILEGKTDPRTLPLLSARAQPPG